jgi:hypothetical protein
MLVVDLAAAQRLLGPWQLLQLPRYLHMDGGIAAAQLCLVAQPGDDAQRAV